MIRKLAYQLISKHRPRNSNIFISFFVKNNCLNQENRKKNAAKHDGAYFSCAKTKEKSTNERKKRRIKTKEFYRQVKIQTRYEF